MKKTSTTLPPTRSVEARLAAVEAELARLAALAVNAQRSLYRVNWRFEGILNDISAAAEAQRDVYESLGPLDDGVKGLEGDRAVAIDRKSRD